ncbi:MAG: hypothetical protein ACYDFT_03410 [Thermoplasmata archaeon]
MSHPRTAWIVAPPELCVLCGEPLVRPAETSSWNGRPAHQECVRIHLMQRDPAFRAWGAEEGAEPEPGEADDEIIAREDDDEDTG